MSKEVVIAAVTLAGGVTFVVHPHAAIEAAANRCFFLATPWAAGNLDWWRLITFVALTVAGGFTSSLLGANRLVT
jgi:hypothetical protein